MPGFENSSSYLGLRPNPNSFRELLKRFYRRDGWFGRVVARRIAFLYLVLWYAPKPHSLREFPVLLSSTVLGLASSVILIETMVRPRGYAVNYSTSLVTLGYAQTRSAHELLVPRSQEIRHTGVLTKK